MLHLHFYWHMEPVNNNFSEQNGRKEKQGWDTMLSTN